MSNQQERKHILYGFAVEPVHDAKTLAKYVSAFPDLRSDLIELAWELKVSQFGADEVLADMPDPNFEEALNDLLLANQSPDREANPFGRFRGKRFADLSDRLGIPRGFMVGIRDKRTRLDSIPERFLAAASKAMEIAVDELRAYLGGEPKVPSAAEFKTDNKPTDTEQVTFEQLIEDTKMSDEQRKTALEYRDDD